jgi:hypothetical protein
MDSIAPSYLRVMVFMRPGIDRTRAQIHSIPGVFAHFPQSISFVSQHQLISGKIFFR